jgi:hypothetical protein
LFSIISEGSSSLLAQMSGMPWLGLVRKNCAGSGVRTPGAVFVFLLFDGAACTAHRMRTLSNPRSAVYVNVTSSSPVQAAAEKNAVPAWEPVRGAASPSY